VAGHQLIRPSSLDDGLDGPPQDLDIQPERVVFDIVQILVGVQVHRLIGPAVDLPPAGQPLWYLKPLALPGFILVDQPGQLRPRSHQAHLACEDVEKLRQSVQTSRT